ncbi:MAG: hypothetical protein U0002_11155 [Thermoanaerobaculia bacterium]
MSFLLLALLAALVGQRLAPWWVSEDDGRLFRWALATVAGLLLLFLALSTLTLLGIPWSRASVLIAWMVPGLLLGAWVRRSEAVPIAPGRPWSWAELVAVAALVVLAGVALQGWSVHPDFIYHWGIKAEKDFLARGFDFDFRSKPWNIVRHPDYPNFLPGLDATTALFAGRFDTRSMLLGSVLAAALVLVAARETLLRASGSWFWPRAALAALALAAGTFGVGFLTLGGADGLVALAPLLAAPALLAPGRGRADAQLGLAAAFAAASKVEGIPLGAFLGLAYLARRGRGWVRSLPWLALPPALVVGVWFLEARRHGLFVESRGGWPSFTYLGATLRTVVETALSPEWHGSALLLLAWPLLWFSARARPLAWVTGLQALFYLYVYLSFPSDSVDTAIYLVRSNGARLLFHLFPTVVLGLGLVLSGWFEPSQKAESAPGSAVSR